MINDSFESSIRDQDVTVICDGYKILEVLDEDGETLVITDEEYTALSIRRVENMTPDLDE
jgi:hypothetical protein